MEIKYITDNILLFQFDDDSPKKVGINIVAVIQNEKYLLIDLGYKENTYKVFEYLLPKKCSSIIFTHFHPDHISEINLFNDIITYGSSNWLITLKEFKYNDNQIMKYAPDITIDSHHEFQFGENKIRIINNPGHSICGQIIEINNKVICVGDDIIRRNNGDSIIPYLTQNNIKAVEHAYKKILEHSIDKIVIPGHGRPITRFHDLKRDISCRIRYFELLKTGKLPNIKSLGFRGYDSWNQHNLSLISSVGIK